MHSDFLISVAAEISSATPPLLRGFPALRAFIAFMALGAAFMAFAAAFIAFIGRTMAKRGEYKNTFLQVGRKTLCL